MNENVKNKPKEKYIVGGVSVTVWENTVKVGDEDKKILKFTVGKSYKDKDGVWQNTNSFDMNDLYKLQLACYNAFNDFGLLKLSELEREK